MTEILYRKSPETLRQELYNLHGNGMTIVFMDCKDYKERLPSIKIEADSLIILGSEYQIFNMKRSDTGPFWDHFWKTIGIDIYKRE